MHPNLAVFAAFAVLAVWLGPNSSQKLAGPLAQPNGWNIFWMVQPYGPPVGWFNHVDHLLDGLVLGCNHVVFWGLEQLKKTFGLGPLVQPLG